MEKKRETTIMGLRFSGFEGRENRMETTMRGSGFRVLRQWKGKWKLLEWVL